MLGKNVITVDKILTATTRFFTQEMLSNKRKTKTKTITSKKWKKKITANRTVLYCEKKKTPQTGYRRLCLSNMETGTRH